MFNLHKHDVESDHNSRVKNGDFREGRLVAQDLEGGIVPDEGAAVVRGLRPVVKSRSPSAWSTFVEGDEQPYWSHW